MAGVALEAMAKATPVAGQSVRYRRWGVGGRGENAGLQYMGRGGWWGGGRGRGTRGAPAGGDDRALSAEGQGGGAQSADDGRCRNGRASPASSLSSPPVSRMASILAATSICTCLSSREYVDRVRRHYELFKRG